ncbi:MAG TPA: potassium transporter TrkA [Bacteroidales bacterium]|nr:potassium transporter TrkA [Bacteroidales bacterium]
MKYIVVGLGYFGGTLASTLTRLGHEVIGIDNREDKVDEYKESISIVMVMDTTIPNAVKSLPLDDIDAVIVAIGEDIGSSILTLTILKNFNVKRIIGRAITPIHREILQQIGITEIIQPEEDSALKVSSILQIENAKSVMELNEDNVIAEIAIPAKYIGHSLETINLTERFSVKVIAVKIPQKDKLLDIFNLRDYKIDFDANIERPIREDDILVIAGHINDIKRLNES